MTVSNTPCNNIASSNTLQKDIELCRHTILLIDSNRIESWHPTIFKNNLCSDHRTRNVVDSMGVNRLGRKEVLSLLNILETIE